MLYVLHGLYREFFGIHFLMSTLNSYKVAELLQSFDRRFKIFGPIWNTVLVPYLVALIFFDLNLSRF